MGKLKFEHIPKYTYDDYVNWEGRWELINGIPYAMSPLPVYKHQKVSGNIHTQLDKLLEHCKNCQALIPMDWRIPEVEDNNVLQPDNFVICGEVGEKFFTTTPVLIFEILSPSTTFKDRNIKYEIYESKEVKYYVIVDAEKNYAEVFELKDGTYKKIIEARNDVVKFILDKECIIDFDFGKIWVKEK